MVKIRWALKHKNRDAPKNGAKCSTQQSFRAPRADRLCTLLLPKLSHLKKPCKTILLITKNKGKTMPERWLRLLKRRAINYSVTAQIITSFLSTCAIRN